MPINDFNTTTITILYTYRSLRVSAAVICFLRLQPSAVFRGLDSGSRRAGCKTREIINMYFSDIILYFNIMLCGRK